MRLTRMKAALAAVALAASLAACGEAGSGGDEGTEVEPKENAAQSFDDGTRMKELAEAGSVKVGVKFDQPGIGFKGAADDMPTGFDIEIAKLLVADLGIDPQSDDVKWVETISDNREPFLQDGTVDLVLASYSITPERRQVVGQAGPYFVTGQQLLVRKDSDVQSVDDLQGKEVCSVTGSTSLEHVKEQGMKPVGFDTYSECMEKVLDGTVEAESTDGSILMGYAAQHPDDLKVVGPEFSEERYGVGYSKDYPEMCEWINGVIEKSYKDGTWAKAFEKTLGPSGIDTPEPPQPDPCPAS